MPPLPDTPVATALAQANAALDRTESARALALLEPFEATETSVEYLACLIEAMCMLRQFERAEAAIARALALHPGNAFILHAAGINSFHERKYELAEERFQAAVRAKPDYAKAYNNMGMNYEFMNREDAAIAAYRSATSHDPALATAYKNLGRLAESHHQLDQARSLYEQGRDRTPAGAEFTALLAGLGHNFTPAVGAAPTAPETAEAYLGLEIAAAAERHLPRDRKPGVLDLICGTGTVGEKLWRNAGLIVGVDPRVHLLQQAQAKGVYFDLKDQYPSAYLRSCKRGETDLITSNCGFSNVGDLLPVFLDIYAVLAPGGLLVMAYATQVDSLGYFIEGYGSFSHDPRYILTRADFEGLVLKERIDYEPGSHPQVDRTYTLMVFARPQ
jgi:predicted TPR repeat methyltransferase